MRTSEPCGSPYGPPIVRTTVLAQKSRIGGAADVRLMIQAVKPGHTIEGVTGPGQIPGLGCILSLGAADCQAQALSNMK